MISYSVSATATASASVVFTEVTKGGDGAELLEKSPRHVVDRADIDAPLIEALETHDMRTRHDDGGKEGPAAGNPRERQARQVHPRIRQQAVAAEYASAQIFQALGWIVSTHYEEGTMAGPHASQHCVVRRGKQTVLVAVMLEQRIPANLGKENSRTDAVGHRAMVAVETCSRRFNTLGTKPTLQRGQDGGICGVHLGKTVHRQTCGPRHFAIRAQF
jgi:hypothetical protein